MRAWMDRGICSVLGTRIVTHIEHSQTWGLASSICLPAYRRNITMTPHDFLTDNFGLTQMLMIVAGALLLLAGGKLSQTLVRIIGFLIGGAIGAYVSLNFTDQAVGVVTIIGF